jgi:flagellar hook protein FlgE
MAFQQGLSGLNMSAKALDAVGNNIANVNTVGFKSAAAQFNDVYAAALGGMTGSNSIGQGGSIAAVAQSFTQGNITNTNNPLDIAINGNGFMKFQPNLTDMTPQYSRNGQLHLNKEGYIVNAQDQFLNAFPSLNGQNIDQSRSGPLQLDSAQVAPRATGFNNTLEPGSGGVQIGLNFDVRDKRAYIEDVDAMAGDWNTLQEFQFADDDGVVILNPNMYNYSTSATIYDQRGEPHIMTMYFVRQEAENAAGEMIGGNNWKTHFILDNQYVISDYQTDGEAENGIDSTLDFSPNGQLNTNENGARYTLNLTNVLNSAGEEIDLTAEPLNLFPNNEDPDNPSYLANYNMIFDFTSATQFGSSYDVNRLLQDGYGPGRLSGVAIEKDGSITARYSNGQTKLMGQVALATFQNPNGLLPLGNNMWAETAASGAALLGAPNSGSRGVIQAGAVEDANVDLTNELVNMITLQRAYQANAQTIKTQDQILQTLVNLR